MKLLQTLLSTALLFTLNAETFKPSNNTKLAVEYTLESTDETFDKDFFAFTKQPLEDKGFFLNDPHHNVQNVYAQQVGETRLEQLSFSSLVNDTEAIALLNRDPRIGGFTPFNLVIYRKKSNHKTVLTHIYPDAALDILQITDKSVRASFKEMFKPLDAAIEKSYPHATKSYTKLQGYADKTMMNFEIAFDEPEDIDDFFDEFQEKFEYAFESKGYIIAGFYNMKYSLNSDEDILPIYSQYVVWSLCHIPFSYTIFDGKAPLPKAAMFAPCSMYAYIKEGENKIIIGMPTLNAWAAALNITDKDKLLKINQLDSEIPAIIHSLGGVDIPNTNLLLKK
jgi:uncharacterized protein (DUF302 family)